MSDTNTLDLHGQTWLEALETFLEFYNNTIQRADNKPVATLEVVHGYGSTGEGGVLRSRLRGFLQRHEDYLQFRLDGNPGHTMVIPLKLLPDTKNMLAEKVWDYCANAKSLSKITGRFRRSGHPEVMDAIRTLELQRRLKAVQKGTLKLYKSVG